MKIRIKTPCLRRWLDW